MASTLCSILVGPTHGETGIGGQSTKARARATMPGGAWEANIIYDIGVFNGEIYYSFGK